VIVAILQPTGGDDIDGDTQQRLELLADVEKVEEGAAGLKLDKEVDVARRRLIPPSHGAEHRHGAAVVPLDHLADLSPLGFDQLTTLSHGTRVTLDLEGERRFVGQAAKRVPAASSVDEARQGPVLPAGAAFGTAVRLL